MDDVWAALIAERGDFADLLESLTPEQWDAQSLCADWKVRDVAGHIITGITFSKGAQFMTLAKGGFNFHKAMTKQAHEYSARDPQVMVKELRAHIDSHNMPPMTKPPVLMNDTLTHQQDCRRPLGMPRQVPEDRLRIALDQAKAVQPILGNKKRIAGVKLTASDMDWSTGDGPEVKGPGEALLLAINGRPAALDDLSGEGLSTFRARF
jgi:uncharacterized protein (TIGR03083 family)